MRINYNMSAAIANKHLLGIENNLSQTMERLSSGLKINHAKDNPAGMAISNKMQAQIDGLDRASQNSSDGISVIEIADGALSEVTDILQRMRELSVQAANSGTMSLGDKQAIQSEIEALKKEIDRISTDTEYNSKTLLDGSMDTRIYADSDKATRVQVSDYVVPGNYKLTIDTPATQAGPLTTTGVDFTSTNAIGVDGVLSVNGSSVEIQATDTYAEVFEKIRDAAEIGETSVNFGADGQNIEFASEAYGREGALNVSVDDMALAAALGMDAGLFTYNAEKQVHEYKANGTDAKVTLEKPGNGTGFGDTATVKHDGNRIIVTDAGGFSLSFLAEKGYAGDIDFEVSELGTMTLHVGSNQDQNMDVRIPEVSTKSLFIDQVDVTTVTGADRALDSFGNAIAQVSEVRSSLGAYQNRLDYTVNSLDSFEENMTSAISRLTDADMAEEMTEYTHQNVLNQAAISVLTQANELPQMVLQILQ